MTNIFFKPTKNTERKAEILLDDMEKLQCRISTITSIADITTELLDDIDLENITNTQFKLTAVFNLNCMLADYTKLINEELNNFYSIKT